VKPVIGASGKNGRVTTNGQIKRNSSAYSITTVSLHAGPESALLSGHSCDRNCEDNFHSIHVFRRS
jgi:hypothetical protein